MRGIIMPLKSYDGKLNPWWNKTSLMVGLFLCSETDMFWCGTILKSKFVPIIFSAVICYYGWACLQAIFIVYMVLLSQFSSLCLLLLKLILLNYIFTFAWNFMLWALIWTVIMIQRWHCECDPFPYLSTFVKIISNAILLASRMWT